MAKTNLKVGENLNRQTTWPVIDVIGKKPKDHVYLWIGNDEPDNSWCFATVDGDKKLRTLAHRILKAIGDA
jgi:hypothetical protein